MPVNKIQIKTEINKMLSISDYELNGNIIVVVIPAMGIKQKIYFDFVKFLSNKSIHTITFDYSGIGESLNGNIKDYKNNLHDWAKYDLEAVINYVTTQYSSKKIILIGHSVGGQLIGLNSNSRKASKIILIASQSGYWGFWRGLDKIKMFLNWNLLFPILTRIYGYMPSIKFSRMENLPRNVALEWAKWCSNSNYLFQYISEKDWFFSQINCKITSISIDDDFYAPQKAVNWLTDKYSNAKITKKHLKPNDFGLKNIGHFSIFHKKNEPFLWNLLLSEIEN